jgi:uncharacterized membrane protein
LIPQLHESHGNLWAMSDHLYQYAIGFLSLGLYWMIHHYMFHFIKRADGNLVWLNILFLAFASMVPFWVAFNTVNAEIPEASTYNGIFQILTLMTLLFIWLYATHGQRLVSSNLDFRTRSWFFKIVLIGILILTIASFGSLVDIGFSIFFIVSAVWFIYMTAYGYKKYYSDPKYLKNAKDNNEQKEQNEIEYERGSFWISPDRISALTDGVIAIAITLMVLELSIPNLKENPEGLGVVGGEFFLIGIGFVALGLYWAIHHLIFHFIKQADGILMWLNILFLSFASLVPFWVAYINITEGADGAMLYYGMALILTILILLVIWLYASNGHRLISKDLSISIISGFTDLLLFIFIISIIVIIGNIVIPAFMNVSWIVSTVLFIYLTADGYQRFFIFNKKIKR